MRLIAKYITLPVAVMFFVSCNDYLSTAPDDRTVIDSPDKVGELLVSAYPDGTYIPFCEAMSDNAGDKGRLSLIQEYKNEKAYYWRDIEEKAQDTPEFYWERCYAAIAVVNHALEAIAANGDTEAYRMYKGEALVARAYNHFMVASLWAQRHDPATAARELGIPYVTKPERKVFTSYQRETLKRTYELIRTDLEAGLVLLDKGTSYEIPGYHFTEAAAYGFASRFYLAIGEFELAYKSACRTLGANPADKLRDWEKYTGLDYNELQAAYSGSDEKCNVLLAPAISVVCMYNGLHRFGMTNEVREALFGGANVAKGALLYRVFGNEVTLNVPKFKRWQKSNGLNASTGIPYIMSPLVTMEEVLFNRMEAAVMLGRYGEMIEDVNVFFSKRIADYNPQRNAVGEVSFEEYYNYAGPEIEPFFEVTNKQRIFLKGILDLKRKEFVQEGMRWFDIKRFNIEVIRKDDDGKVVDMLVKNDRRRAMQLPQAAIAEGMEMNPR